MLYPGKHYDVGRTQMGFDDSSRPPMANFVIGCTQHKDAPIFIWMVSDIHVAYAKIDIRMRFGRCTRGKLDTLRFGITFGRRSKTIEAYESITSCYPQRWPIDSKAARSIKGRERRKSRLITPL